MNLVELAAAGDTVCTTGGRDLFCLDGRTGDELWSERLPGLATSPTVVDGTVVVGADGGPTASTRPCRSAADRRATTWSSPARACKACRCPLGRSTDENPRPGPSE
jgi:hypothetical protein